MQHSGIGAATAKDAGGQQFIVADWRGLRARWEQARRQEDHAHWPVTSLEKADGPNEIEVVWGAWDLPTMVRHRLGTAGS